MKSLRLQIILMTLASILLTLTVTTLVTVRTFRTYYTEALTANAAIFAQNVRTITDSLLLLGLSLEQFEGMNEKLKELVVPAKDIAYCHIYDAHGQVLYSTDHALRPQQPIPAFPLQPSPDMPGLTESAVTTTGVRYYGTVVPLYAHTGGYLGAIRVGVPTAAVSEKITTLLVHVGITSLLAFLVAAAIFLVFSHRHITRPISRLVAATQAMARGDLQRHITGLPDNEWGTLATGFNQMTQNLSTLISELEARNMLAKTLISTRDLGMILRIVVQSIAEIGQFDRVRLYLYDEPSQSLVCRMTVGMAEEQVPHLHISLADERAGVSQWVFQHRTPYVVEDVTTDDKCNPALTRLLGVTNYAVAPLLAGEKTVGVVAVDNLRRPQAFTPERLNSLMAFANTAALAIDNALLYQNLEKRVSERTQQLENANMRLQELDRIKTDFLSTVSHELRTPLTSIVGFAKMLARRFQTVLLPHLDQTEVKVQREAQRVADNLGIVIEESERLTRLINNVLDLARIEEGKVEWHLTEVSMREVVQRAMHATSALAQEKRLPVQMVTSGEEFCVYGDYDRLIQVVTNLLSNALKFTQTGSITCNLEQQHETVRVEIIDTGIGIAPEEVETVFDKFHQVGDTLTAKPHGSGLGLSICKEIMAYLGGSMGVESTLGSGSTFWFTLPVYAPPGVASQPPSLCARVTHHVRSTIPRRPDDASLILIVDDAQPFRTLLRHDLEGAGYQVIEAPHGQDAVHLAREAHPDLIILDLMVPDLEGFEMPGILQQDTTTAAMPLLLVSILEEKDQGYTPGVDSYLTRPVEDEQLLATVASLVGQQPSQPSTGRQTILVVEDDEATVRRIETVLNRCAYQVMTASNAQDGLRQATAVRPEVVIFSTQLYAVDDGAFVRALRAMPETMHSHMLVLTEHTGMAGAVPAGPGLLWMGKATRSG